MGLMFDIGRLKVGQSDFFGLLNKIQLPFSKIKKVCKCNICRFLNFWLQMDETKNQSIIIIEFELNQLNSTIIWGYWLLTFHLLTTL